MRVYDLAKQIDMPNKELIDKLQGMGVEVKSHSSSVDDKTVRAVMAKFGKKDASEPSTAEKKAKPAGAKPAAAKSATKEAKPQETAPKKDARAIALEAIARAKARRAQQRQQSVEAPEAQKADVSTPTAKPETAPPPKAPKAPDIQRQRYSQSPQAAAAKQHQQAPPAASGTPQPPRDSAPPRAQAPRSQERARPESQQPRRRPVIQRGNLELQQLPGLPQRKTPPQREKREAPPDLTTPPSIEVMKLKPAKRPPRKLDKDADKRRKPLPEKGRHVEKRIRPGRFLNIESIEERVDQTAPPIRPRGAFISGKGEKEGGRRHQPASRHEPKVVQIFGDHTVAEFADKIGVEAAAVITQAMSLGEMLTLNQLLPPELCELIADAFNVKIEIRAESDQQDVADFVAEAKEERMRIRPPVVTVMGHVDHGKTTLLDSIRKTNVVDGEFGGITQHIGAYRVETDRGEVVFLDTPGHAAFTAMRARGAQVTDIVILIVAADDSLMPQTVEAINHARAAEVPIIVAINKTDLPGANVQKVRNDLMQHSLIGEELGGDTIICEVSAMTGAGIDHLLEMVVLQAEVMELKADPDVPAQGVVIESEIDPQRGVSATVLVQQGTLRQGDAFVCGDVSGRVRFMLDDLGKQVESAPPSHPVEILGIDGCPQVGEDFLVLENERQAREIAQVREQRRRRHSQIASARPHVTLEGLADYLSQDGKPKELRVVLKADVQGSVQAVSDAMQRLSTEKISIVVIHSGVGAVTESDIQLANASDAVVIGFNVRPDASAAELAAQEGIDVKIYRIIYELLEELQLAMVGMLDKKYKEVDRGQAEVRQIFKVSRLGNIAGCHVLRGTIHRNEKARVVRDGVTVYEGSINSLRRVKDDVASVASGYDCGITLVDFQDLKEGDLIETYAMEEVAQTL